MLKLLKIFSSQDFAKQTLVLTSKGEVKRLFPNFVNEYWSS